MIRIHMTPADLAAVRFAPTVGPLAEGWRSLEFLRLQRPTPHWRTWRDTVRRSLPAADQIEIAAYASRVGCLLDFLALSGTATGPADAASAFLNAPGEQFEAEVDYLKGTQDPAMARLERLAGDPAERRAFLRALHRYTGALIGTRWAGIEGVLSAHHRAVAAEVVSSGLATALGRLHTSIRFHPASLLLTVQPAAEADFSLEGRGLVVAPAYYTAAPVFHLPLGVESPAVLTYPVELPAAEVEVAPDRHHEGLASVLGTTRATMLATIAQGRRTQSELADAAGTTTVAISQHAAKLRAAGLITSRRWAGRAQHHLTEAGEAVLGAGPATIG
ncbi:ArsR/SmtB family transcription factor [Antribacter gilvus]|uniref:ArsR/SmtB family transcription factor n=1 Tax=Antribacter gilvus TaxID=2304675 RepID=UPI000F76BF73|nr:winged helix-turn-helix domain-containing protein [Antribacter gilvus]